MKACTAAIASFLQLIGTLDPMPQRKAQEFVGLVDGGAIPARAILLAERNERAAGIATRVAPRVMVEHQR